MITKKSNTPQAAKIAADKSKVADKANAELQMPLGKQNYILMAAGFGLIVLGFILMTGGGNNDPNVFEAERLFSFRRITLAPILVLAGFALEVYAIMKRPKE